MVKELSIVNKEMQEKLNKLESYKEGISVLLYLRNELFNEILRFKKELTSAEFSAIPFINVSGYHSKTIAYSIYHIFRIEDIVAQSLIKKDEEIFFSLGYDKKINSPIITTGNELVKEEIQEFSKKLNLDELYSYINEVKKSTDELLQSLSFNDLKIKMTEEDKKYLKSLKVLSDSDKASWLIDYWCSKDIKGLIRMPFSRHWIMHVDAMKRIEQKLKNK